MSDLMGIRKSNSSRKGTGIRWVCPSTRAFWEVSRRTPHHSTFDFLHGYFYSRWPYLYIEVATGEHKLAKLLTRWGKLKSRIFPSRSNSNVGKKRAADKYHAKVLTNSGARQLVMVKEDIRLQDLEQIIPYRQARDLILTNPDQIVVIECPCRSSRPNPCLPLNVCLIVGEPFAGFILEHHPERARWIESKEACDILEASHERGHVHHAFFNEPMLNRFFGICNCCTCCCAAMQAMRNGIPMIASSGYKSVLELGLCMGCAECVPRCPFGALMSENGTVEIDGDKCMGCGICVSTCEVGALSLVRDLTKSAPLEIDDLVKHVDFDIGQVA